MTASWPVPRVKAGRFGVRVIVRPSAPSARRPTQLHAAGGHAHLPPGLPLRLRHHWLTTSSVGMLATETRAGSPVRALYAPLGIPSATREPDCLHPKPRRGDLTRVRARAGGCQSPYTFRPDGASSRLPQRCPCVARLARQRARSKATCKGSIGPPCVFATRWRPAADRDLFPCCTIALRYLCATTTTLVDQPVTAAYSCGRGVRALPERFDLHRSLRAFEASLRRARRRPGPL